MKNGAPVKKIATPKELVGLARKAKWRPIKLSSGDVVPVETIRAIFEDAAASLKRKPKRSRPHATAS